MKKKILVFDEEDEVDTVGVGVEEPRDVAHNLVKVGLEKVAHKRRVHHDRRAAAHLERAELDAPLGAPQLDSTLLRGGEQPAADGAGVQRLRVPAQPAQRQAQHVAELQALTARLEMSDARALAAEGEAARAERACPTRCGVLQRAVARRGTLRSLVSGVGLYSL